MVRLKTFPLAKLATLILIAVAITFTACSKPPEVTCNVPYIKVGSECCLDQNSNLVCDKDESASLTAAVAEIKQNATGPAAVCNRPYILVGTQCCLDKNDNAICDSDESVAAKSEAKLTVKMNPEELLDSLVTIIAQFPVQVKLPNNKIGIDEAILNASGFIVSEDGRIITNEHVVKDYIFNCFLQSEYINRRFTCKLKAKTLDGEIFDLDWLSMSWEWDVAVLRIKGSSRKFEPLEIADESGKIGDSVFVLGEPVGLEFSITKGIISQKNRESLRMPGDKTYSKYLQTDASVNPGNSGGPILDDKGKVVGMATFGYLLLEGLNFGLQSEVIREIYHKTFNETPLILEKTNYLQMHGSDSFTKEVKINEPANAALVTSGKEVRFDGVRIGVDNKKNSTIMLCFNDRLITFYGIINYNRESDQTEEMKPQSNKQIDHYPKVTIDSDYTHFYLVDVFDCDTRQTYGRVYGPGTYKD